MATKSSLPNYMQGPLYAFSLPQELLDVIQLRTAFGAASSHQQQQQEQQQLQNEGETTQHNLDSRSSLSLPDGSALRCTLCGAMHFESITEQRAHFSSDWHRYNIKQNLAGKDAVTSHEWDTMVEGLSDSISGTASSSSSSDASSDEAEEQQTKVSRLLSRQSLEDRENGVEEAEEDDAVSAMGAKSPLLWFEAPQHLQDTQLALYKTIFPSAIKSNIGQQWIQELKTLQVAEDSSRLGKKAAAKLGANPTDPASRKWTLLAVGGGHFAGAVVSLVPQLHNRNGRIERELVLLQSKTFHRYTTRRKQGGAQSANDQAKSKAKSAGAQIRRYNETMLTTEIRELLSSWKEDIASSELIFLRAGKTSQRIFYDYEEAVLERRDPRMRSFPFPTRRPTQTELVRCFTELTRIKLSHLTAQELAELEAAYRASIEAKKPAPIAPPKPTVSKPEVPKLSKEEILEREKWERVLDMIRRDKVEVFKNFIQKQSESTAEVSVTYTGYLPAWTAEGKTYPTVLHYAAANEAAEIVFYLLSECRSDPTITFNDRTDAPSNSTRKTAYEVATSRLVRDAFRRAYAEYPDLWDWENSAKVPSKLTEEMLSGQNAKRSEHKSKLKDKMRERAALREQEREAEEARQRERQAEEERQAAARRLATPVSGPQRLGGGPPRLTRIQQQQNAMAGLSEEARRRIERERRVKAAEARAQQAKQSQ